jgi:molybdopterin/thiamine biosynthesis adenylyltransferase
MGIGYGVNTSLKLYDFDKVESINCAGGIFPENLSDCDVFKVDALKAFLNSLNSANIITYPERYISQPILDEVVVLCLDSIEQRLAIVDHIVSSCKNVKLIIDTRSGWHQGQVFLIDPSNKKQIKKWKSTLNPDTVEDLPCGAKAVAYNPVTIAGFVGSSIRNYFNDDGLANEFLVLHSANFYEVK